MDTEEGVVDGSAVMGTLRPGTMKLQDVSGPEGTPDGVVDDNDITEIGNVNPKFVGGFNINARAYGFDLSANFNFSLGNKVYNANKIEYTSATYTKFSQYRNLSTDMASGKRWTNVNEVGEFVTDPTEAGCTER